MEDSDGLEEQPVIWTELGNNRSRPGWPDDGFPTHSSEVQTEVEQKVRAYLHQWEKAPNFEALTALKKDEHYDYLVQGLYFLPEGFQSLDASRPWLLYWILHSLELMGCINQLPRDLAKHSCDFLERCQHPDGGFGGGPGQQAHLAPTYAACNAVAILGGIYPKAYDVVNREKLHAFLLSVKHPCGGFRVSTDGEVDTRGAYTCLAVASLMNIMSEELTAGTAEWLKQCQTYEGGIGGEPGNEAHGGYAFCGLAAMMIMGKADMLDLDRLLKWAVKRQMPLEGGFQGRTNKLVDGCYSFWVGGVFPLLDFLLRKQGDEAHLGEQGREWLFNQRELQKYLLVCCQMNNNRGGMRDKPGKHPDYYHTCYCLSGLSTAQHSLVEASCVVGKARNKLLRTNPVYNVEAGACEKALQHFSSMSHPDDLSTY